MAISVGISALGADQPDFNQAYRQSLASGRPLVVLIGADWCPGCQTMKNSVLPQVAKSGGLEKVVFIYVDYDQQRQLASHLKCATSIPQLIRFDQTPTGWKSQCLVGAKSPLEVYNFINSGFIKKKEVSKVSSTHLSGDTFYRPSVAKTPTLVTTASASQTTSSVDVPPLRGHMVRSPPVRKTGWFSNNWMVLQKTFPEKKPD
ncbi:MAG: thioredoxin family protein [Pirellulales bacterium]|nr:thioredoxin family protein [Pirellulales bacterium]